MQYGKGKGLHLGLQKYTPSDGERERNTLRGLSSPSVGGLPVSEENTHGSL